MHAWRFLTPFNFTVSCCSELALFLFLEKSYTCTRIDFLTTFLHRLAT